ncbi:MAG TPA: translation initiation factor IF-2 [Verrucomicrobiae bacterium]|nr:translation initiation factor IF-2 [Verrucomicrobiae bacterium]
MPVRIYDIAKQLNIPSKDVLSKAKDLGISNAKVPSSSLDKITAEFLIEQLSGGKPVEASAETTPAAPAEPAIKIVTAPPPEPEPAEPQPVEAAVEASTDEEAPAPTEESESSTDDQVVAGEPEMVAEEAEVVEEPEAIAPPKPVEPAKPGLGEKVGFINLAPRQPRPGPGQRTAPTPERRPAPGGGRGDQPRGRDDRQRPGGRDQRGQPRPGVAASTTKPADRILLPDNARIISLKPPVIVRDLADKMAIKPFKLIADLMELGVFANVNQAVDDAIAKRVCAKYGFKFEVEKRSKETHVVLPQKKELSLDTEDKPEDLKPRAPVVTIMGHVDHGKTTLLDVIRKSNVVAGEAGGITQHIGAYTIAFPHPERKGELQQITFLDTPGHAAFSAMRARGANVTDIVILVVAANDGVMPQTLEALNHAKAAKVPIIVAVNKCDHPAANAMRVKQQLQEKGLVADDWGGDTIFVEVSALQKKNVDKLLEMILLQADLLELKANPDRRAVGNVIESGLESGGPTATVLVRKGTLRVGDVILCDQYMGKVRALINEEGQRLKEAIPSVAVRVLGLNGVPEAGSEFNVVESEKSARELAEERQFEAKAAGLEARSKVTLENLFATLEENVAKILKVVVKADTQGSVEAIVDALNKIDSDKVSLDVIHSAVGTITKEDIMLASAGKGVVLGFHTRIDIGVADLAKREGVQIKLYAIIYELIDQVKDAMAGLLDPISKEVVTGSAEVRRVFELSKGGNVAGCMVTSGRIVRGKVRVQRKGALVYEGVTQSLRRFQDEVNEVRAGMECGIRIDGFNDFEPGDAIECYAVEHEAQKL